MAPKEITLRVRSSEGTKRVEISSTASGPELWRRIKGVFELDQEFSLYKDQARKNPVSKTSSMRTLGLKHGDMLYMFPKTEGKTSFESPIASTSSLSAPSFMDDDAISMSSTMAQRGSNADLSRVSSSASLVSLSGGTSISRFVSPEDEVDIQLQKMDGKIPKPKTKNCNHPEATKCVHCFPYDPYDEEYLKEKEIKHMSFHAYLKKMSGGMDKGKYAALEDTSCSIKEGCKEHKPWPKGICSKCQPAAVTLNRQKYRHVDNIMFENQDLVNNFLAYWRNTGNQRIGYLYGRYEVYTEVPLGIKAVVGAIYEPPQECSRDGLKLVLPDENEEKVDSIAAKLGMRRVGWIFTDLVPNGDGTVKHFRNMDSHFLSAQECITAGHFQTKYPNVCRAATAGIFGSKFCTVVVTGNSENQIQFEGYQVSNQCMALVRDKVLLPTKDAPELGYVRESSNDQYVPDVFFKEKDVYGNEITKIARPLPVEYLLVDVPASAPLQPQYTFFVNDQITPFPIENRPLEGHIQDLPAFANYRRQFPNDQVEDLFRDFHVLVFLATQTVYNLWPHMDSLLEAIRVHNTEFIYSWTKDEHWQTIEMLMDAHNGGFQ